MHFQRTNDPGASTSRRHRFGYRQLCDPSLKWNDRARIQTVMLVSLNDAVLSTDMLTTALTLDDTGFVDYVFAPGGSLQRNFVQQGFGLFQNQKRNRMGVVGSFPEHLGPAHDQIRFRVLREQVRHQPDVNRSEPNAFANPLTVRPVKRCSNPANNRQRLPCDKQF